MTLIHGQADDGYGALADAFAANFAEGGDVGAACTVYRDGRPVVELHGGVADTRTGRAWAADTVAPLFSVTKGLVALCAYLAHARGQVDFDAPVTRYWPEFGREGKQGLTVRDLFSHRAGVPAIDGDLTLDEVAAWEPVVRALEAQVPLWEPGTAFAYHPLTYGWLTGEVLSRATGSRPGALFADGVAGPLGVDAWIGLPEAEDHRVARLLPTPALSGPQGEAWLQRVLSRPHVIRSVTFGGAFSLDQSDDTAGFNSTAVHRMELPAANGIGSASALARTYAATVSEVDGVRLLAPEALVDVLTVRSAGDQWPESLSPPGMRFGTGFMLDGIPHKPLLSPTSFGHDGSSGAIAFADVDARLGFGYVTNQLGGAGDTRANRLTEALRRCVD